MRGTCARAWSSGSSLLRGNVSVVERCSYEMDWNDLNTEDHKSACKRNKIQINMPGEARTGRERQGRRR